MTRLRAILRGVPLALLLSELLGAICFFALALLGFVAAGVLQ